MEPAGKGQAGLGFSWGSWSPLGAASVGVGWHNCYIGQGIKAGSLSCGSLESQEFWKLRHELQKHLASHMGWNLGNSAQAMSLQTFSGGRGGAWPGRGVETQQSQALMAGPA